MAENRTLEERMSPEERQLFEKYRSKIGQEFTPEDGHQMFFPLLNDGDIRWSLIKKWAIVNDDTNPLWFDEEYAKSSRWGGIIAPPLFLLTISDGAVPAASPVVDLYYPLPECVMNRERYPNFRGSMQANSEWEFFEPVRPGDRITAKAKLTDIYWKQGKRFRLLFAFGETSYTNQKGHLVACCRAGAVYLFK